MEEFKNSEENINQEKRITRGGIKRRRTSKVEIQKIEEFEKIERKKIEQEKVKRERTNISRKTQREIGENGEMILENVNDSGEIKIARKRRPYSRNIEKANQENMSLMIKQENRLREYSLFSKNRKKESEEFKFKKPTLRIIPLGGLHEIGKNITVFEYGNDMIVVDCGLSFPEDDMLGIDLVIPDITYIVKNQDRLRGIVITHGHEDHIGGVPYFLKQINAPIYGTRLTLGLIKNKLEEHHLLESAKLNDVEPGETIKLGNFKIEFIQSSHSIPDSVMFAITTPVGTVLHTGDFKIDYTPIDGKLIDLGRIAELGNQGILALMSDSTNAERKGFTMSEGSVGEVFDKLFIHCNKRIVVATFASNVHRVQQIVNCAIKYGRKIAVCGRSMINMITTARELGYIECPDNLFIDIDMINRTH